MFEITTRPPNSYLLQQQQQQQQHRRNQTLQFRSPRSSSLSSPVTTFASTSLDKHFPQFFLHNDINNLTLVNNNTSNLSNLNNNSSSDYVYSSYPSNKIATNETSDRYVTRILTNGAANTDNRLKKLVSTSSTSYFHDLNNSHSNLNTSSSYLGSSKSITNGTVLPVYYQSESTGQTTSLSSQLPTLRSLQVTASKPPINYKTTNVLPTLSNNIGSATSIVSVSNANNTSNYASRQLKPQITSLHSSYSNLNDDFTSSRLSSKNTYNIPLKSTDSSDYTPKLTTKQYTVIKGIKARQEMQSSNQQQTISDSIETKKLAQPKLIEQQPTYSRQSSFASSTGSLNNLASSSTNSSTSNQPATKSILVNKKRFANPLGKKTVSFAT